MVEVAVRRRGQFQRPEANIVQGFVVDTKRLVGVLHQLVDGQRGVVRFHDGVGHLRGRHHAERVHYTVRVLLPDFRYQQGAHTGACAATKGVGELETLQTVAVLRLAAHHVHDRVDQLGPFRVMAFSPVVTCKITGVSHGDRPGTGCVSASAFCQYPLRSGRKRSCRA